MSVLVKGMEMPTRCEDCPMGFSVNFGILCTPTHNIVGDGEISKKQNWCPLVPVPPHGRLIDADALMEKFLETYTEYERKKLLVFYAAEVKQEVADMITDAPTIISAEEGE